MPAWIVVRDSPVASATNETPPWGKEIASAAAQTRRPRSSRTAWTIRYFFRKMTNSFPMRKEYAAPTIRSSYLCAYPYRPIFLYRTNLNLLDVATVGDVLYYLSAGFLRFKHEIGRASCRERV